MIRPTSALSEFRLLLLSLSLLFFLTLPAYSQTGLNVRDFGAVPDDGFDDSSAIQDAVDAALLRNGGTIVVPAGKYDIRRTILVIPKGYVGADIMFAGQKGAVFEVSVGGEQIAIAAGNLNSLIFEDLTFVGRNVDINHPQFFDARHVIHVNYVNQFNVTRCNFFGLATQSTDGTQTGVIFVGNTDAKFTDSQFDGDLSVYPTGSIIEAVDFRGLSVSRCTFLDYANFGGEYFSKSTGFVGAWIRAKNTNSFDKSQQRRIVIEDSRFDEGAAYAIDVINVPLVHVRGIYVNVNGTSAGRGIRLNNVDFARIDQSAFGWAPYARPAIEVFNCGGLYAAGLKFSEQVFFLNDNGVRDLKVEFCPQCTVVTQPASAQSNPLKSKKRR